MDEKTPIGSLRTCLSVLANDTRGQMSELERIPLYAALGAALCELEQLRAADEQKRVDVSNLDELSDDVLYVTLAVHLIELWQGRPGNPKALAALVTAGCGRATAKANQAEQLCLKLCDLLKHRADEPWMGGEGSFVDHDARDKWREWKARDPGGLTQDETKAIEDMRKRWRP